MADHIVANKGTITGSIGVISAGWNLSELMKKHGVKMNVVKQGKNKDMMAYWRDMEAEERQIMEDLSKSAYNQFVETVSKGRNIPMDELLKFADGRIVTGEQAHKLGLVDTLGGFMEAVRIAAVEVGLDPEDPNVILSPEVGFQRFIELLGQEAAATRTINFIKLLETNQIPVLYYMSHPVPFQALDLIN